MHLTSIYRVPGSTYVSVEVEVGATAPGPVEFTSMSIIDASGLRTDTNAVANTVAAGRDGVWTIVADDVDVSSVWEVSIGAGDREVLAQLAGSYVPQLSAKQYDWFEPTTGQYFDWKAILDDHRSFRSRRHGAVLMAPYEFSDAASAWYRTLVPQPYDSESGVRGWCESNGYQWGVTCIARRVDPW